MRESNLSIRTRLAGALLALVALGGSGCFTYGTTSRGRAIEPARFEKLAPGASTLADVTAALGAPVEVELEPERLVLVYRAGEYEFWRLGLDAGLVAGFAGASFPGSENLKFTYEKADYAEDRLVVELDRNRIVAAIGHEQIVGGVPRGGPRP